MKNMENKRKIRNLKKPYMIQKSIVVILFIIQEESFLYSYF